MTAEALRLAPGYRKLHADLAEATLLFRRTPHCRVINNGADAFRIGDKGKVLGAPIRKGANGAGCL